LVWIERETMEALIQTIAIAALPVIFAITLHEAAHGYAARYFGDPTAWQAGRISLNPLRHIDPVGTLLVPGLILATSYLAAGSAMLFGWAKPVPVNFGNLRSPKRDMLWVAAAGPASNLLMALVWAALLKATLLLPLNAYSVPLVEMSKIGINVNIVLLVLNLLPLPPLDGGRIAVSLLPHALAWKFAQLERWGFPILLLLLFTGVLGSIMGPFVSLFQRLIISFFQLN
jgi:Zn-dependent protease